jgi:CRISPR-associated endoribonuclease Cas6
MSRTHQPSLQTGSPAKGVLPWPVGTELLGLELELIPELPGYLPLHYTRGFHAWFLDQMRQIDPSLSAALHDLAAEKAFGISGLEGPLVVGDRRYLLQPGHVYRWSVMALSRPVVEGLAQWVQRLPSTLELRTVSLKINTWAIALPPTTYLDLLETPVPASGPLNLSFITPTSFRYQGHHLPLPMPRSVFQSYLRRWNIFSGFPADELPFLNWVDKQVQIFRHRLESAQVNATAKGTVIGFTGSVEFGLLSREPTDFVRLFWVLGRLAPYVGTGHKTPMGMGQTRLGWRVSLAGTDGAALPEATGPVSTAATATTLLAKRIQELRQIFLAQRKRQGGTRALDAAQTWATILARRELGDDLRAIAADLALSPETARTYLKRARRCSKAAASPTLSDP